MILSRLVYDGQFFFFCDYYKVVYEAAYFRSVLFLNIV